MPILIVSGSFASTPINCPEIIGPSSSFITEKQKGFLVAFVPFNDGKPSGEWQIFADGFAGIEEVYSPSEANHRPTGLAQGPDGSLYVSDDAGGTLFRIVYNKK